LTRFGAGCEDGDFAVRSSREQTESVGDDRLLSAVHVRELTDPDGEWQLECVELAEPDLVLVAIDSSADRVSEAAFS